MSQITSSTIEACQAYTPEELSVLNEDCAKLWDDVKCLCIPRESPETVPAEVVSTA